MSTFDLSTYLSNKITEGPMPSVTPMGMPGITPMATPALTGIRPQQRDVVSEKAGRLLLELEAKKQLLVNQQTAKEDYLRKINENSWSSRLGLDYDSTSGQAVNNLAGAISTGARITGDFISAPLSMGAQAYEESIDPRSMDILQRQSRGEAITPEEDAWINTPTADMYDPNVLSGPTPKQMFQGTWGFENTRRAANDIRDVADIKSIVDTRLVQEANENLISNPEYVAARDRLSEAGWDPRKWDPKDLTTLLSNMGRVAMENPGAAIQLIAENVPQIALSIMSPTAMVTSNIGYAQSYYDKWSENFVEREKRQPTLEEKKDAQTKAWSLAAAETVGDVVTAGAVKSFKGALGIGGKAVPTAAKEALTEASKGLAGRAVSSAGRVAGAGVKGVLGEMPTEGYQTAIESLLEEGKPASFDDVYFGSFAGAVSGGGLASGGKALTELAEGSVAREQKRVEKAREEVEQVIKGDTSSYLSNQDPTKNNWRAAATVIVENADLGGKSAESNANSLERLDAEVFQPLVAEIDKLKLKTTEGRKEAYEREIALLSESLTETTSEKTRNNVENAITQLKRALEQPVDVKQEKQAISNIKKLEAQLVEVQTLREGLASKVGTTTEDSVIASIQGFKAADTVDEVEVQGLVKRLYAAPRAQSVKVAEELSLLAESGKVSEATSQALKTLSKSINALEKLKNLETVSSEVLGTAREKDPTAMKGVKQYLAEFELALGGGFMSEAKATYEKLSKFLQSREEKANALASMQKGEFLSQKDGIWTIEPYGNQDRSKGFNTAGSIAGAQKSADKIRSDLNIAYPILDGMAQRINLPIQNKPEVKTDGTQTTETKQTEEKRSEEPTADVLSEEAEIDLANKLLSELDETGDIDSVLDEALTEFVEESNDAVKGVQKFADLPEYKPGQQTFRYAGIGSRQTPQVILDAMAQLAERLAGLGYILQSGGAEGADRAFESGAGKAKEIFYAKDATDVTRAIAKEIHPAPNALKQFPLNLMARNTNQIFGKNLDSPVDFVLAWTPDGAESSQQRTRQTGGTGQAIDMASRKGIPVINLANPDWEARLEALIQKKAENENQVPKDTEGRTEQATDSKTGTDNQQQANEAASVQEDGSDTRDGESSSQTADTKDTDKVRSRSKLKTDLDIAKAKLKRYQAFLQCLNS